MTLKKIAFLIAVLASIVIGVKAYGQSVPATMDINWTLPTTHTDGTPIPTTGDNSLAKVEGWISSSAIPNSPTTAASFTLTPVGVTTRQTVSVPGGSTVRVRLRACTQVGVCSALTSEVTKVVPLIPGVPTNVTLTITITPTQ